MPASYCYPNTNDCICENIIGEKGDCVVDMNDQQIFNLFWAEVFKSFIED